MMHYPRLAAGLACALVATALAAPAWAVPTSFTITGDVASPRTDNAAALAALPQTNQTVTYRSGNSSVTDTFYGPTLWNVLAASGGITTDPAPKNGILRQYVVATGADGYKAVISAGEIAPRFGDRQDLIGTSDTRARLPMPDGFARVVATGDVAGGRYVSNLTNLDVRTAPAQNGTITGPTTHFVVNGQVMSHLTFDLTSLEALPEHQVTVTYMSGNSSVTDTYTGALLWDVLAQAGLSLDTSIRNDVLRKLVTATGSDGYQVDFALGELSPDFGNAPILVAYSDVNGQIAGGAGFARLVVPGDIFGGRYVSNLSSLTVFDGTEVPEPASLALLAGGIVVLASVRRRLRVRVTA